MSKDWIEARKVSEAGARIIERAESWNTLEVAQRADRYSTQREREREREMRLVTVQKLDTAKRWSFKGTQNSLTTIRNDEDAVEVKVVCFDASTYGGRSLGVVVEMKHLANSRSVIFVLYMGKIRRRVRESLLISRFFTGLDVWRKTPLDWKFNRIYYLFIIIVKKKNDTIMIW